MGRMIELLDTLFFESHCFFSMYCTPPMPSKSASCVHRVALFARAVARMMLSAMAILNSFEIFAALTVISWVKSAIIPSDMTSMACSAPYSPRWANRRLNTSYIQAVGTTRVLVALTTGAKKLAFVPLAKYSNQPEESTTFIIRDLPFLAGDWCQCLQIFLLLPQ